MSWSGAATYNRLTRDQRAQVCDLARQGLWISTIKQRLGIPYNTIKRALAEANIAPSQATSRPNAFASPAERAATVVAWMGVKFEDVSPEVLERELPRLSGGRYCASVFTQPAMGSSLSWVG